MLSASCSLELDSVLSLVKLHLSIRDSSLELCLALILSIVELCLISYLLIYLVHFLQLSIDLSLESIPILSLWHKVLSCLDL